MARCNTIDVTPHRSYRKLHLNKKLVWFESIFFLLTMFVMMDLYLDDVFNTFIEFFYSQLQSNQIFGTLVDVEIFTMPFKMIDLQYAYLQPLSKFIWLICLFLGYFIMLKQKIFPYNVIMWINFFIILTSVFVLYFIFFSEYFPYTVTDYTELYLTATFGFLFFSALIMITVFILTPIHFILKFIVFVLSLAYFMVFTLVRFALTLLLATQVSVIFAPMMFFTLYLDFFFFVSIYTYILYWKSMQTKKMDASWMW